MYRDDIKPNRDEFDERSAEEILRERMREIDKHINNKLKEKKYFNDAFMKEPIYDDYKLTRDRERRAELRSEDLNRKIFQHYKRMDREIDDLESMFADFEAGKTIDEIMEEKILATLTCDLLEVDEVFTFERENIKSRPTDLAILEANYFPLLDASIPGEWYTKTQIDSTHYNSILLATKEKKNYKVDNIGIRPIIRFPNIDDLLRAFVGSTYLDWENTIIKLGEYPQNRADAAETLGLNLSFDHGLDNIKETGKSYTIRINGKTKRVSEYEYNGKKYVRIMIDDDIYDNCKFSQNNDPIKKGEPVWLKVEPITWIVDKEKGLLLSEKILASGISMGKRDKMGIQPANNYEETEMNKYITEIFSKEIIPGYIREKTKEEIEREEKKKNPYHFEMQDVGEEEILKGAIESGVPVFIHGKSGDGKSARVREIDPDCTIIYLLSEGEEKINGIDAYSGEDGMISEKPVWLKKLEEKCEKEPDKTHILFFDELTNAHKTVQAAVFNIILNKEVKGLWKLPDNVRIVAAGNETEESIAANELAEPLFNRFAHVYIETTPENWLEWASKHGIHPAIYTFIGARGEKSLRTEYTGKEPNADPRKWEMASKMLYATNNPKMLRGLLGEDETNEGSTKPIKCR